VSEIFCLGTKTVAVHLSGIPNEPITFAGQNQSLSEDGLIAYTWSHFLKNPDQPYWLAQLPMTKAVVRAMDTIQTFIKGLFIPTVPEISNFVISGGSKRGWITWTTAVVDKRVVAIAPIVIPILNIVPNLNEQWRDYGEWSFALDDYIRWGVPQHLNTPVFKQMAAIIDPYSYLSRLTMPKYIICSTGDEFFLPDGTRWFYSDLLGSNYLRMVTNAEHTLTPQQPDVAMSVAAWYNLIVMGVPRPRVSWIVVRSNTTASIVAQVDPKNPPTSIYMWYAQTLSSTMRDFRLLTCPAVTCFNPVFWYYQELPTNPSGVYQVEFKPPPWGWLGFLIEFIYEFPVPSPNNILKVTTEVNIVPDSFPFESCGQNCGQ